MSLSTVYIDKWNLLYIKMGATVSIILPPRITKEDFKEMGGNIYSEDFFEKLKGTDECIDRKEISEFAFSIADIYMYVINNTFILIIFTFRCYDRVFNFILNICVLKPLQRKKTVWNEIPMTVL